MPGGYCRVYSTRLDSRVVNSKWASRKRRGPLMIAVTAAALCGACDLLGPTSNPEAGGLVLWHVSDSAAFGQPGFDGTTVFFTSKHHTIVAVDATSGAVKWRAATGGDVGSTTHTDAGCVIAGELVACGDDDIVAFRRSDGSLVWRYHAQVGFGPGFYPFREHAGVIYGGSQTSGTLYAIDAATGAERWAIRAIQDTAGVNVFGVSVDDDIVVAAFITGDKPLRGGVVAVDPATGALRWITYFPVGTFDAPGGGFDCALWSDVVLGSSIDASVYALDRETGAIRWVVPPIKQMTPQRGDFRPIVVVGSTLFSASAAEVVTGYDLSRRAEIWRTASPEGSSSGAPLAADDGAVYVVHANGRLVAYSIAAHSVNWDVGAPLRPFFGTAAVGVDRVFIGSTAGFWALSK
jgi:outer membrane protein assembly factor BamB